MFSFLNQINRRTAVSNVGVPTKDQYRNIGMDGTNSIVDNGPCVRQKWNVSTP